MKVGAALPDDLVAWVEEIGGGRVMLLERKPGGGRKEAWFVDLERPNGSVAECFLRYDRSDPERTKDPWTLHREATVYLALQDSPVPVPAVIGVHPVRQAMLSERVAGENWFSRISDEVEREATASDFMAALAALHRLDTRALDLPAFPSAASVRQAVLAELDEWDEVLHQRGGEPDPAIAFTLAWLRRHIPEYDGPPVLVQGDTGPGNFMFAGGKVTAVVDWELAHLGDPMDDIAWLSLRATQEPFGDFLRRLRQYEELSGNPVDPRRVHYYRVMAEAKLQVMSHRGTASAAGPGGGDAGNAFIYGLLHRRLWLEALGAATGIELDPVEKAAARESRDHDWMYGTILAQLRDVIVPGTADPLVKARAKGIARLVKFLAERDTYGDFYEECELADLERLLGHRPPTLGAGRAEVAAAVRADRVGDEQYVGYLWRRIARDTELARPAMGVLADRHWPALDGEAEAR